MSQIPVWLCIIIAVLAAGAAGAGGFFLGVRYRKNQAEATIGSAEEEAKRIVGSAVKTAEARKKEIATKIFSKKCSEWPISSSSLSSSSW